MTDIQPPPTATSLGIRCMVDQLTLVTWPAEQSLPPSTKIDLKSLTLSPTPHPPKTNYTAPLRLYHYTSR